MQTFEETKQPALSLAPVQYYTFGAPLKDKVCLNSLILPQITLFSHLAFSVQPNTHSATHCCTKYEGNWEEILLLRTEPQFQVVQF